MNPLPTPEVLFPPPESHTEDCDCACEVVLPPLEATAPASGLWRQATEAQSLSASLPPPWHAVIHPTGPVPLAVLNEHAWRLWQRYTRPHLLDTNPTAHELARRGFLQPAEGPAADQPTPTAQRLTAWLHLTNTCNLACPYCYLRKTSEHMDWPTAQAAVDRLVTLAQRYAYPALKLKYAGGEPLLRFAFLQRVHAYAQQRTTEAGLKLEAVVITNGTLLHTEQVDYFTQQGIAVAVSLDGLGPDHDRQRPFPNGEGSFEIVARNLIQARSAGAELNVNITVTDWNLDGLPKLVAWLLSENLPFSLNFYRENDCAGAHPDLNLHNERLIAGLRRVYQVIEANLPPWSLLGRLTDRGSATTAHNFVCAAGRDYLVIDHRGRIAPCQMLLGRHIVTDIYAEDPLAAVRQPTPQFHNLPVEEKEPCKSCPWRYWCAGGCPLVTFRHTGRFDVRSPFCEVYKTIYPEVLRLEALRLIQYTHTQRLG